MKKETNNVILSSIVTKKDLQNQRLGEYNEETCCRQTPQLLHKKCKSAHGTTWPRVSSFIFFSPNRGVIHEACR